MRSEPPLIDQIPEPWLRALPWSADVARGLDAGLTVPAALDALDARVLRARAGEGLLPAPGRIFAALRVPPADVRVVILGQDPYPDPRYAMGLAFSTPREASPLPASLRNIYRERESDVGLPPSGHGDLTAWADQGVLLLNAVLTVAPGQPAAHRDWGWQRITGALLDAVHAARGDQVVYALWGRQAQAAAAGRPGIHLASAHPSPLSASRGFFGSRPFSRVNDALAQFGSAPVDWRN